MKIVFIAGCLEPGRDGVGDYTRALATECARRGHEVRLLSVGEPAQPAVTVDGLPTLRLTADAWRADGGSAAQRWLEAFAPDWASLQFVPYSFAPRGFFAPAIPALMRAVGTAPRRHLFVHEVWIGSQAGAPLRARVAGWWQRRAVARLLRLMRPALVHTSARYHIDALATLGQPARRLPLFGHVPVPAVGARAVLPGVADDALVCGLFGTLYDWRPDEFLADYAALAASLGRPAALVAAGGLGAAGAKRFARLAERWSGTIACRASGRMTEAELAAVFARFDCAATSMPWNIVGKSSSAASLRLHGLRVVVTAAGDPPRFRAAAPDEAGADDGFVPYFRTRRLERSLFQRTAPGPDVGAVAERFLADLHGCP